MQIHIEVCCFQAEAVKMINEADLNKDGKVDYRGNGSLCKYIMRICVFAILLSVSAQFQYDAIVLPSQCYAIWKKIKAQLFGMQLRACGLLNIG